MLRVFLVLVDCAACTDFSDPWKLTRAAVANTTVTSSLLAVRQVQERIIAHVIQDILEMEELVQVSILFY